jgi:type II secretory pathway component PulF
MRGVLLYPGITLVLAFVVLMFILVVVVPRFQEAYAVTNITRIPKYTQLVLDASAFLRTYLVLVLGGIAAGIVLLFLAARTGPGARLRDWIYLRLPVIGMLYRKILLYRFASLMHLLLESGVAVQRALQISAVATGNLQLERSLLGIADSITRGRSIEASFREHGFFPDLFVDMIGVGEEAGAVNSVMLKLAATYEEDVDSTLNTLGLVLEPVMVLLIGSVVLLIAVAVFVPYLSMSDAFLSGQ